MAYEVVVTPAAQRQLAKLPQDIRDAATDFIERLAKNPRPFYCKKMSGVDAYRIKVGREYRVIYSVQDNRLTVIIIKVGHRRDVYRDR